MFESFEADVCQEDLPVFLDFFAVFFFEDKSDFGGYKIYQSTFE